MARKVNSIVIVTIVMLSSFPRIGRCQQEAPPRRMIPALSVFVGGSYYSPNFKDVNAVYAALSRNYFLPGGSDFKDYYNLSGGLRFSPVEQQSLLAEVAVSMYKSQLGNSIRQTESINYLQTVYVGGTYLVNFPLGRISLYAGAGAGYMWLNTQRTYSAQSGVARVNAGLFQLHGTGGIEFFHSTSVSLALEGGYSYATTPHPKRADLDFTLQGPSVGLRVSVPIINSL